MPGLPTAAVWIDTAQSRITEPLKTIGTDGRTWDYYRGTNTFVDPVTLTGMLRPYALTPEWANTATGNYARYSIADYESQAGDPLLDTEWAENPRRLTGDIYLENLGVNTPVFTIEELGVNRGVYLSFWVPDGANYSDVSLEFGWGEIGAEGTVSCRVYAGGQVEVYKRAAGDAVPAKKGDYSITGNVTELRQQNLSGDISTGDVVGRIINLFVIPCRRRELLMFGTGGNGFSHTFEDLDATTLNEITPAGRFWWLVAQGKASVQFAPLLFPTTGRVLSQVLTWRTPPLFGGVIDLVTYYDSPGPSLTAPLVATIYEADGTTTFTPNNITTDCRLGYNLASTGVGPGSGGLPYSGFLYAGWANILPTTVDTDDEDTLNIADYVFDISLSVGEDASGTSGKLNLTPGANDAGDAEVGAGIADRNNRPVDIKYGSKILLSGVLNKPGLTEAANLVPADKLSFDIFDGWARLEATKFLEEPSPFDGELLTDTVGYLLDYAGVPSGSRDIETSSFRLDSTSGIAKGELSYQPRVGDSVAQWLQKFQREFAWTWYMGWVPTSTVPKFRFRSESTLSATPKATIYCDRSGDSAKKACLAFREEVIAPEATRISVIGFDPRLKQILRATYADTTLENPLTPSVEGWVGEVRPVGIVEPRLTTADGVERTRDSMAEKLAVPIRIAEWQCPFLQGSDGVTLWKGDVVRIHPKGDYRIISLSGRIHRNAQHDGWGLLRFSYVGKKIGDIPEG